MRKFVIFLVFSGFFSAGVCLAGEDAPAILSDKDGKNLRVFLMGINGTQVSTEYQRLREKKVFDKDDILFLNFSHKKFDQAAVDTAFNNADYTNVISVLAPVVAPYVDYMTISNNLQDVYGTLMRSYCRSGQYAKAAQCVAYLIGTKAPDLKLKAQVCGVVATAGLGDLNTAKKILAQIKNPAASLYAKAVVQRDEGHPRDAIQTAVDVIAEHANDIDWMPCSEFLCAELYLDLGRTNSALVTARQTQKLYKGMNIEKEAEAFRMRIKQSTVDSE